MSGKRRERRALRRVADRFFLATGNSGPSRSWLVPPFTVSGSAAASGGHTRRMMRVEQLESRIVLSTTPAVEFFSAVCTPLDAGALSSNELNFTESATPQYGPQQMLKLIGPEQATTLKTAASVEHLQMPAMPGLASLDSSLVGAIAQAWDIPVDSTTESWVVGLAAGQSPELLQQLGFEDAVQTPYLPNTFILSFAESRSVTELQEQISGLNSVEFCYPLIAEQLYSRLIPTDTGFRHQWYLSNTGQAMPGQTAGTAGQDINVVTAWDSSRGNGVVIGIVDDGVQYTHYDLAANAWTNPGEIAGNGIDDDGNGYIDDVYGYDFNSGDGDPAPVGPQTHGTQMAGIAAASMGNIPGHTSGIVGTAMGAKFASLRLTAAASTDAQQAAALSYQNQAIQIYNNSWGSADNGRSLGTGCVDVGGNPERCDRWRAGAWATFMSGRPATVRPAATT